MLFSEDHQALVRGEKIDLLMAARGILAELVR